MIFKKNKKPIYASSDFLEAYLPHDRKSQFKFIFKTRKQTLLKIGFIILLFFLPLLITLLYRDFSSNRIYEMQIAKKITEQEFLAFFAQHQFFITLLISLSFLIASIGIAGISNIYKKLIFGEPVFFKKDFLKGIKNSSVSFLLITLIISLFLITLSFVFRYMLLDFWFILFLLFFLIVIYPMILQSYFYMSFYSCNVKAYIKNTFSLFLLTNFKGIGISLGLIGIPLISNFFAFFLMLTPLVNEIITVAYLVIFVPIYLLMMYCYYARHFDENINKKNFPSYYNKGLYLSKKDNGGSEK